MEQVQKAPSNIVVSTILLSKPGIIVSVAFTGFAGMVVADKGLPPLSLGLLTMVSLLLSAAGSAILNNVLDKQIDVLMKRLSKRAHALEVVGGKNSDIYCELIYSHFSFHLTLLFKLYNCTLNCCRYIKLHITVHVVSKEKFSLWNYLRGSSGSASCSNRVFSDTT